MGLSRHHICGFYWHDALQLDLCRTALPWKFRCSTDISGHFKRTEYRTGLFHLLQVYLWGVAGAALATVLAQVISGVLCLLYAFKILPMLRLSKEKMHMDTGIAKLILIYGVPTGLQMSIISISDMTLQAMINTYGTALVVAYGVSTKVEGLGWQMADAIGTSLGTFVGQNVGAGNPDRVKKGVRCAYLMDIICYGIFCPVIWFFASPIMQAFTQNTDAIRCGIEYIQDFQWILSGSWRFFSNAITIFYVLPEMSKPLF